MADISTVRDDIKRRLSLAGYVGREVKLTRKNREFTGLCPFHPEKTPSFSVVEDKGFYHCFGCGANGDVFNWHTDKLGMGFGEALVILAKDAGVTLPERDKQPEQDALAPHRQVMNMACLYFQHQLQRPAGKGAKDYLTQQRDLSVETIETFRLGYAPRNDRAFLELFTPEQQPLLVTCGLARERGDSLIPFFYDRLMFPIVDDDRQVIAFGARILEGTGPKYLNSPATPLFDKGKTLYNHVALLENRRSQPLVVEGYMDVIALHQAGFLGGVAPLGTAVTEDQLAMLWRRHRKPIICADGDDAGRRSAYRTATRALPLISAKKTLQFAMLPAGQDPDDLIRAHGKGHLQQCFDNAYPLHAVLYSGMRHQHEPLDTPEDNAAFEHELFALTNDISDKPLQFHFRRAFGQLLRGKQHLPTSAASGKATATATDAAASIFLKERILLLASVLYPLVGADMVEAIAELKVSPSNLPAFDEALLALSDYDRCCSLQERLDSTNKGRIHAVGAVAYKHFVEECSTTLKSNNLPLIETIFRQHVALLHSLGLVERASPDEVRTLCHELLMHIHRQQLLSGYQHPTNTPHTPSGAHWAASDQAQHSGLHASSPWDGQTGGTNPADYGGARADLDDAPEDKIWPSAGDHVGSPPAGHAVVPPQAGHANASKPMTAADLALIKTYVDVLSPASE